MDRQVAGPAFLYTAHTAGTTRWSAHTAGTTRWSAHTAGTTRWSAHTAGTTRWSAHTEGTTRWSAHTAGMTRCQLILQEQEGRHLPVTAGTTRLLVSLSYSQVS